MSNSSLVSYTKLSPHRARRTHVIDTITIHCMAGDLSVERCGAGFCGARKASSNYGVGSDGRVALYVDEGDRSVCSSNTVNDNRAVTIEVANCGGAPDWPVSDAAYKALIELVTDVCYRNGIPRLLWRGDSRLVGQVDKQNMTVHRWFAAKACPGNYLYDRHAAIAAAVNERLEEMRMTGQDIIARLSDAEAYALLEKAQRHAATLPPPDWAVGDTVAAEQFEKAKTADLTDGTRPMALPTRLEAALLAYRAVMLGAAVATVNANETGGRSDE